MKCQEPGCDYTAKLNMQMNGTRDANDLVRHWDEAHPKGKPADKGNHPGRRFGDKEGHFNND